MERGLCDTAVLQVNLSENSRPIDTAVSMWRSALLVAYGNGCLGFHPYKLAVVRVVRENCRWVPNGSARSHRHRGAVERAADIETEKYEMEMPVTQRSTKKQPQVPDASLKPSPKRGPKERGEASQNGNAWRFEMSRQHNDREGLSFGGCGGVQRHAVEHAQGGSD